MPPRSLLDPFPSVSLRTPSRRSSASSARLPASLSP